MLLNSHNIYCIIMHEFVFACAMCNRAQNLFHKKNCHFEFPIARITKLGLLLWNKIITSAFELDTLNYARSQEM